MKDNTPIILLVVFLVLVLAGILIYVFVFNTKTKTPPTNANQDPITQPGTQAGAISDDDLEALAKNFHDGFADSNADALALRCNAITSANNLSTSDLNRLNTIYQDLYNNTMKAVMDDAWTWCGILDYGNGGAGQNLYEKLA